MNGNTNVKVVKKMTQKNPLYKSKQWKYRVLDERIKRLGGGLMEGGIAIKPNQYKGRERT